MIMKALAIVTIASVFFIIHRVTSKCDHQAFPCWHRMKKFSDPSHMSACFEGSPCRCYNVTVNCSSNNLSFVPFVGLISYRYLNFSNNNLQNISDENVLSNVSREVEVIDLFSNGLVYVSPVAFQRLYKLKVLLLGGLNHLGYSDMSTLLSIRGGVSLDLGCLGLRLMPMGTFQKANKSKTTQLNFSWNRIPSLNMSTFQPLQHLLWLKFWRNEIYDVEMAYMPTLTNLSLEANRLYNFPQTCSPSGSPFFPNLQSLALDQNMISCVNRHICLPSLTFLSLSYNNILFFPKNMFPTSLFPSLRGLKLMQMEGKIRRIDPYFINNSVVTYINFLFNQVDFSARHMNEDAFGGCTSVQILKLRANNFGAVSDDRLHRLLGPMMDSLMLLSLSQAELSLISVKTFSGLTKLKRLSLFKNKLTAVPDGAFNQLPKLKILELDGNFITAISKTTFSPQLQNSLETLTLGGNPFHCSCDILWLQHWMKTNPVLFKDYHTKAGYTCANKDNITIPDFILDDQACMLGSDAAAFTISITCVFILFFLLFTLLFRFRWHVRLLLYEVCRGGQKRRLGNRYHYKYDVFVSYAEENVGWVEHELVPKLEGQFGLRVCVHHRDFVPGKHIVDNISDCVEESRRILLVFSPYFARSQWCQFELKMCQTCVMDRDDVLVLVALQAVSSRDMTGAMLAVLRTTTYIEWEDKEEMRAHFWGRLRLAVEDGEGLV